MCCILVSYLQKNQLDLLYDQTNVVLKLILFKYLYFYHNLLNMNHSLLNANMNQSPKHHLSPSLALNPSLGLATTGTDSNSMHTFGSVLAPSTNLSKDNLPSPSTSIWRKIFSICISKNFSSSSWSMITPISLYMIIKRKVRGRELLSTY